MHLSTARLLSTSPKLKDFFSSPIKLAPDGREHSINRTSLQADEALELQRLVMDRNVRRTLEIGLALGSSAVAIAEALEIKGETTHHIALDPFQSDFGNVGLRELERLGLRDRVDFYAERSEEFLLSAAKSGRRFDLILDDGYHTIGQKVTDTFFADRCLDKNGILVFHDAFLASTAASVRYLVQERGYELIQLRPDSRTKRRLRTFKYWRVYGLRSALRVIPR